LFCGRWEEEAAARLAAQASESRMLQAISVHDNMIDNIRAREVRRTAKPKFALIEYFRRVGEMLRSGCIFGFIFVNNLFHVFESANFFFSFHFSIDFDSLVLS
jgi:hypothetical protein